MVVDITRENFEKEVMQSDVPVMAYFQLPNWAKCVVFKSFGEGLEGRNPDKIKLARFDITKNQAIARELGVASTPSFVIFKDGQELQRFLGDTLMKDDIEQYVNGMIE